MRQQPLNQRLRIHLIQAGALLIAAALLFGRPVLAGETHELIEMAGFALVLICVAGRMWSILYIGARKNRDLTTLGPYSMTRNPLYLFSTIGAIGVGLIYGSLAVALLLGALSYAAFWLTARKEADHLRVLFGERYEAYAARTPIFWPNPALYRDSTEMAFSPDALRRTFLDGLLFLAIFPVMEALEYLQVNNILPALFHFF
ncbi:MAG: isoprenylcysteine carboxyl methyltransferase [Kaistia sp. SCN 65-12]|nr:MAG: isoprenylcysteine carboxyl methyltransferase [Kaistia sp. SCN 65-12]